MAIHIGRRRAGWPGLLWPELFYPSCRDHRRHFRMGIRSLRKIAAGRRLPLRRKTCRAGHHFAGRVETWPDRAKTKPLAITGIIAGTLSFAGVNELLILLGAGLVLAAFVSMVSKKRNSGASFRGLWPGIPVAAAAATAGTASAAPLGLWPLFLFF